jgi:3-deoxy-D-manno-octulosonic-acid transferase
MTLFYFVYAVLIGLIFLFVLPFGLIYIKIKGKHDDHMAERLGWIPPERLSSLKGKPRIWFHAVSLGEVRVAEAVITDLRKRLPDCAVILSTTTRHGRDLAESLFGDDVPVIYGPLDMVFCVRKALHAIRPHALIFVETEIWPAWVFEARRMGARVAMINGRISQRSFQSYRRLRPFFRQVLDRFDFFGMIRCEDRDRIVAMGAPEAKVAVNGNAKYDNLHTGVTDGMAEKMRLTLGLPAEVPVMVAGSTREGEEEMVIDAWKHVVSDFPDTILIIAPRHIQRSCAIGSMLERRGHGFQFRTKMADKKEGRRTSILIMDTFGELFNTYSAASVVFCGASLVPLGGQNPFEPAAWGKPVLYGPSMEDFLDAKEMLESAGGGMTVADSRALAAETLRLFEDPKRLRDMGEKAKTAVLAHQGAAEKYAGSIAEMLAD